MYYLQSRYYNPTWGSFINADALVSTGQGNLGVTAIPVPDGPIAISAPHISGQETDFLWHITVKPVRFWGIFADGPRRAKIATPSRQPGAERESGLHFAGGFPAGFLNLRKDLLF